MASGEGVPELASVIGPPAIVTTVPATSEDPREQLLHQQRAHSKANNSNSPPTLLDPKQQEALRTSCEHSQERAVQLRVSTEIPTLEHEKSDDYHFNIEKHLGQQYPPSPIQTPTQDSLNRVKGVAKAVAKWKGLIKKREYSGVELLNLTPPFTYMCRKQREELAAQLQGHTFNKMAKIYGEGDSDRLVYLLGSGQVVGISKKGKDSHDEHPEFPTKREVFLSAPALIGANDVVVEEKRQMSFFAVDANTVLWSLPAEVFEKALMECPAARYALSKDLKLNKKLFQSLEGFVSSTSAGIASGSKTIDFRALLAAYRKIKPSLHPHMDSYEIDTAAWIYAIRRLPVNVSSTYVFLFTTQVPPVFLHQGLTSRKIVTAGRRRLIFALAPGKDLILIREDESDVLDFLSCLCLHAVEAEKLRRRLLSAGPWTARLLQEFVTRLRAESGADSFRRNNGQVSELPQEDPAEQAQILSKLPLSEQERRGLSAIWPCDLLQRMWEIMLLHEDYHIALDLAPTYQIDTMERWIQEIRSAAQKLLGLSNADDLPSLVEVDLISSNTHSVVNCCSAWLHSHSKKIMAWVLENLPEYRNVEWYNSTDALYSAAYRYFKEFPAEQEACHKDDMAHGMITLSETELTGIQVNLIDLSRLDGNLVDPCLRFNTSEVCTTTPGKKRLLINIDYAFGKQAENIISALIYLFGPSLRSVNVLGKAGGFQGSRGDIIMTSHLIMQDTEDVININNEDLTPESLRQLSGRNVWKGGVLTVRGTLLQNRGLLLYFKKLWNCVSLEMEGSFYARKVVKYQELGFLRKDIAMRFLYYVSDLPLCPESNLSSDLSIAEGVPPLYATTRAFLQPILRPQTC